MKMKKVIFGLFFLLVTISGCAASLSKRVDTFESDGISYEIQLPNSWEKKDGFENKYSKEIIFGAEDKKSNSKLLVMAQRKKKMEFNDSFGKEMKKKLAKQYGYQKVDEIYMDEFSIGKNKGFKYTLDTMFDEKESWLHLYYIETENSIVQLNFYSAKDGSYKERAKIIDESAKSIKETADAGPTDETSDETFLFKNDDFSIQVTGVLTIKGTENTNLLALKYSVNNTDNKEDLTPMIWTQAIEVKQGDSILETVELPKNNAVLEVSELFEKRFEKISVGNSLESVVLYQLKDTSNVLLIPSEKVFPNSKDVPLEILKQEMTSGGE